MEWHEQKVLSPFLATFCSRELLGLKDEEDSPPDFEEAFFV